MSKRTYYYVGSHWKGEYQTDRFLKEGIWDEGRAAKEGNKHVRSSVKVGDIFVLNTTAIGKVTEVVSNTRFKIDWFIKENIPLIKGMRHSIQEIGQQKDKIKSFVEDFEKKN